MQVNLILVLSSFFVSLSDTSVVPFSAFLLLHAIHVAIAIIAIIKLAPIFFIIYLSCKKQFLVIQF